MPEPSHKRYFRRWTAGEDLAQLLRPENQCSTPWGSPDGGGCDKCREAGVVRYGCRSCLECGAAPDCPACQGRVTCVDVCPTCESSGEIDRHAREGVSAFPSLAGLYRYLAEREADGGDDCVVVELEGELTGDRDLDADAGAVLIRPTRVIGTHPFDREAFERKRTSSAST
ncbi:MAG TPA: hypothetical protein VG474_00865 [Solirubrobacteraceae bacterium]|nr:hypothetical protein [Solirubrobacteraceae bacterium]